MLQNQGSQARIYNGCNEGHTDTYMNKVDLPWGSSAFKESMFPRVLKTAFDGICNQTHFKILCI